MKSLDQIEPRTPVDATHTPGNFLASFIISQPGSYYLTNNLTGENGKRGIEIDVGNVTLDLNGFAMQGVSGSANGVYFSHATDSNVAVRNGSICGWGGSGIYHLSRNGIFEQLVLATNLTGITCGDNSQVRGCTIADNVQSGIYAIGSGNLILKNNCANNNTQNSASAGGIYVAGNRNRIEGNHVSRSDSAGQGIYVGGTTNIVVQNSVLGGNGNNYSISGGNLAGPLINVAGTITNNNPWANFSY
jgi:parallel beta-helix repeat protein